MTNETQRLNQIDHATVAAIAASSADELILPDFQEADREASALEAGIASGEVVPLFGRDDQQTTTNPTDTYSNFQDPDVQTSSVRPRRETNDYDISLAGLKARKIDVMKRNNLPIRESIQKRVLKRTAQVGKGALLTTVDVVKSVAGTNEPIKITNPAEGLADLARRQNKVAISTDGSRVYNSSPAGKYQK